MVSLTRTCHPSALLGFEALERYIAAPTQGAKIRPTRLNSVRPKVINNTNEKISVRSTMVRAFFYLNVKISSSGCPSSQPLDLPVSPGPKQ